MKSSRNNEDWDIRCRLQWPTWAVLAGHACGLPWIELSVDVKKSLAWTSLPGLGVSVELRLGLAELETVCVGAFAGEEELALAGPVRGFDEAGDDGLGALWRSAVSC